MPRVSIILCSYNQAQYVGAAIESVLAQTFGDWELLAIDNGSTDGSSDVMRRYQDPRIRVIAENENVAITRRFNQGVAAASGELVGFLYSDDLYLPEKLELQVREFDRLPSRFGVVHGIAESFNDHSGEVWRQPPFRGSGRVLVPMLESFFTAQLDMLSPLSRRECFLRYPFYEDVFAEGESVFLKLAMGYEFHFLDRPLVRMRNHAGNRGRALWRNAEITLECLERLGRHPDFPSEARGALEVLPGRLWSRLGWWLARLGEDGPRVREAYRRALGASWREVLDWRTMGGLALSCLPSRARARVNQIGFWLSRSPGARNLVGGYGGTGPS